MKHSLFTILLLMFFPFLSFSQSDWGSRLKGIGMENIRVAEADGVCYIAWDDPVFRGGYRGLAEVIREVVAEGDKGVSYCLMVQENSVPRIVVDLESGLLDDCRDGKLDLGALVMAMDISCDTDEAVRALKGSETVNRGAGKMDFVIYPQLGFRNAWLDKIYGVNISVAPAVEMQLWRGAYFTGQVIFPIWNNQVGEMDYIRAGMLTVRQDFWLPKRFFASVAVGNFNQNRFGADVQVNWRTVDDRWLLGVRGGYTGASVVRDGKWMVSRWERPTGAAWVRYYEPHYQLEMELTAERYIYGDYGVRADCVRHFGEVTVGFFAMVSGGEVNGGFNFSVPLWKKQRKPRKFVSVRLPEYWGMELEAQTGNEYAERRLGRRYNTRPAQNRNEGWYQPEFVRKGIWKEVR